MGLDTIINAALVRPARPTRALVLMGGGARAAYQAGVLRGLSALLRTRPDPTAQFPFEVLIGTSAGALNAAFLASAATQGTGALDQLAAFWSDLTSQDVYQLKGARWTGASRWITALRLWGHARREGAILDNQPLLQTLRQRIPLHDIDTALESGALAALAVTASSYSTGLHWTFCHTARDADRHPWQSPGRRGEFQPITLDHLLASSAIPFLFPAVALQVDLRREYFGDGSMRQVSPLSPALRLGAHRILVIGAGQPQRAGRAGSDEPEPTVGTIAGHALASVFHDTVQADVEQARRVSRTLAHLPRELTAFMPYRSVEVQHLQPSESLDALALAHLNSMPRALRRVLDNLGATKDGAALASYLLFEQPFVQALMQLGERDAFAQRLQLLAFFDSAAAPARA